jgi:hypothetical protein
MFTCHGVLGRNEFVKHGKGALHVVCVKKQNKTAATKTKHQECGCWKQTEFENSVY